MNRVKGNQDSDHAGLFFFAEEDAVGLYPACFAECLKYKLITFPDAGQRAGKVLKKIVIELLILS